MEPHRNDVFRGGFEELLKRATAFSARGERVKADLILLAVAVVWGSSFVAGRSAAAHLDPFLYNGSRFFVGLLTLLPLVGRGLWEVKRAELWGGALAGSFLFGASSMQQIGLESTTAGKSGLITGMYVILVPLFLTLIRRRWPHWSVLVASLLAMMGLFLLSGVGASGVLTPPLLGIRRFRSALTIGDAWTLASAVLWALHVIFIGWLAQRTSALRLAVVQYSVCGLLNVGLGLALGYGGAPFLQGVTVAWWAVLYAGVLSIGLGFTLQVVGQRRAPAADAAIIMSLEAVFATFFGWLLLGETLTAQQFLGCGLMFAGMLLAQANGVACPTLSD